MTGWKALARRRVPEPCNECGGDNYHPLIGLCEKCWPIVYARFCEAMGWPAPEK